MGRGRRTLLLLSALASPTVCLPPIVTAQIVENGGPADLDIWLGECPYDSNSSCRGLVQAVKGGRVLDAFESSNFTLIASGMNRMFALTSTYHYSFLADGQHNYEAINMRYYTKSSDTFVLCEQAAVFQLKKADGLVYAPVTSAIDSNDAFGLSFFKDGQRGNKLWIKPYAHKVITQDGNSTLPFLTLTMLPTTVLSTITKRACTAAEINAGVKSCFLYVLRKTRHDPIVLRIPVRTVKPTGVGHNEIEDLCWKAFAIDQGELSDSAARAKPALGLSWLLLTVFIVLLIATRR